MELSIKFKPQSLCPCKENRVLHDRLQKSISLNNIALNPRLYVEVDHRAVTFANRDDKCAVEAIANSNAHLRHLKLHPPDRFSICNRKVRNQRRMSDNRR